MNGLKTGIARRLSDAAADNDLTLAMVAEKTGINESTLRNYASGARVPKLEYLTLLAEALNVSIYWLVTGNRDENHVVAEELGLSDNVISRLAWFHKNGDNTLSDAINALFSESTKADQTSASSGEWLLKFILEFLTCEDLSAKDALMLASIGVTTSEVLQLKITKTLLNMKERYQAGKGRKADRRRCEE